MNEADERLVDSQLYSEHLTIYILKVKKPRPQLLNSHKHSEFSHNSVLGPCSSMVLSPFLRLGLTLLPRPVFSFWSPQVVSSCCFRVARTADAYHHRCLTWLHTCCFEKQIRKCGTSCWGCWGSSHQKVKAEQIPEGAQGCELLEFVSLSGQRVIIVKAIPSAEALIGRRHVLHVLDSKQMTGGPG